MRAPTHPDDAEARRGRKRGRLEMSFAAWDARVTVMLETSLRASSREHRKLVLRGGFAREHEYDRPRPFKLRRRSRFTAACEVRGADADDRERPHARDAAVAVFDPRIERTGAGRAFVFETNRNSVLPHTTGDRVWHVASAQVDGPSRCGAGVCLPATSRRAAAARRSGAAFSSISRLSSFSRAARHRPAVPADPPAASRAGRRRGARTASVNRPC